VDWSVGDEGEAARAILAHRSLDPGCGFVLANPVPEAEQLDPTLHDEALRQSLDELRERGVRGKEVTPFLLQRFRELTGGESLEVNKRLVLHNARLAARVAVRLAPVPIEVRD
jgi:pseudouridine-5'-phosphate glycosidase